jgi:hypothetical protein
MTYVSPRGIPLLTQQVSSFPIVTLEDYVKWYGADILWPDGRVENVNVDWYCEIVREYPKYPLMGDHNYHPFLLEKIAERIGGQVCWKAREMATGRWINEIRDGEVENEYPF